MDVDKLSRALARCTSRRGITLTVAMLALGTSPNEASASEVQPQGDYSYGKCLKYLEMKLRGSLDPSLVYSFFVLYDQRCCQPNAYDLRKAKRCIRRQL